MRGESDDDFSASELTQPAVFALNTTIHGRADNNLASLRSSRVLRLIRRENRDNRADAKLGKLISLGRIVGRQVNRESLSVCFRHGLAVPLDRPRSGLAV